MKKILWPMMALYLSAAGAWASLGDERFRGGSYDGWDRYAMDASAGLGGALISFSSGTDQTFAWTAADAALATLTIEAAEPAGTITNGGTMRVTVPTAWGCRFDTSVSVIYGGNADIKVGEANFADGDRTLNIPVTVDFTDGDTLTISGLKLLDLALCREGAQRLELDFTGNGSRDVYDQYSLMLTVTWPGGAYDGWDRNVMDEYRILELIKGTMILIR